jgi:hypothetical protein
MHSISSYKSLPIPDEIVDYLFTFFPLKTLLPLSLVCKHWLSLVRDDRRWKRICENRCCTKKGHDWYQTAIWQIQYCLYYHQGKMLTLEASVESFHLLRLVKRKGKRDPCTSLYENLLAGLTTDKPEHLAIWFLENKKQRLEKKENPNHILFSYNCSISLCRDYLAVRKIDNNNATLTVYHSNGRFKKKDTQLPITQIISTPHLLIGRDSRTLFFLILLPVI